MYSRKMKAPKKPGDRSNEIDAIADQFLKRTQRDQRFESSYSWEDEDEEGDTQPILKEERSKELSSGTASIDLRSGNPRNRLTAYLWSWVFPFGGLFYTGHIITALLLLFGMNVSFFVFLGLIRPESRGIFVSTFRGWEWLFSQSWALSALVVATYGLWTLGFLLPPYLVHRKGKRELGSSLRDWLWNWLPICHHYSKSHWFSASVLHLALSWILVFPLIAFLPWVRGITISDSHYQHFFSWGLPAFGSALILFVLAMAQRWFALMFSQKGFSRLLGILVYTTVFGFLILFFVGSTVSKNTGDEPNQVRRFLNVFESKGFGDTASWLENILNQNLP
ncbi:MAG: hypothetical protein R3A11_08235 [Bdellovibrionota bacterium]